MQERAWVDLEVEVRCGRERIAAVPTKPITSPASTRFEWRSVGA